MYVIASDFDKSIQSDNLAQVISSRQSILNDAIDTAVEECASYLRQKYDLAKEFTLIPAYDKTATYKAADRVYLTAPLFQSQSTYILDDLVTWKDGLDTYVYKAKDAIVAGPFDASEWTLVCFNNQIFYGKYPSPLFDLYAQYKPGESVYYNGKVYVCQSASAPVQYPASIDHGRYEQIPYPNGIPGVSLQWNNGTAYTITANTISDATKWVLGDNRSKQIVMYVVDLALYHVHSRIAPRNIPDVRVKRYDDAIRSLKRFGSGELAANLPVLQPKQGGRIRYGGNVKNQNGY